MIAAELHLAPESTAEVAPVSRFSEAQLFPGPRTEGHLSPTEVINRRNARFDRLADVGALLLLGCVLASLMFLGGWFVSMLVTEVAQIDIIEIINGLAGLQIVGR